jgi:hypothetical protein
VGAFSGLFYFQEKPERLFTISPSALDIGAFPYKNEPYPLLTCHIVACY